MVSRQPELQVEIPLKLRKAVWAVVYHSFMITLQQGCYTLSQGLKRESDKREYSAVPPRPAFGHLLSQGRRFARKIDADQERYCFGARKSGTHSPNKKGL